MCLVIYTGPNSFALWQKVLLKCFTDEGPPAKDSLSLVPCDLTGVGACSATICDSQPCQRGGGWEARAECDGPEAHTAPGWRESELPIRPLHDTDKRRFEGSQVYLVELSSGWLICLTTDVAT